mmetsp:Transcript_4421/g.14181  ORF Transcript_4421/g.14181 Transcript_4421/m.14181 type:complete len:249 (+) Transcript_4421:714-1460(+)
MAGDAAGCGARCCSEHSGGGSGAPGTPGPDLPPHLRRSHGRRPRAVPLPAVGESGRGRGLDPLCARGPRGPLCGPRRLVAHPEGGRRRPLGNLAVWLGRRGRALAEGRLAQRPRLGHRGKRFRAPRGQHLLAEARAPAAVGLRGVLPRGEPRLLGRGVEGPGAPAARGGPQGPRLCGRALARGRPQLGDAKARPLRRHGGAGLVGPGGHGHPLPQGWGDLAPPLEHHVERGAERTSGRLPQSLGAHGS